MPTPTHHLTTHVRFEFDKDGRTELAAPYRDADLGPDDYRLYIPQVYPGVWGAIVPRGTDLVSAEKYARTLIEENGGCRP